jgi:CheY-like chemotaxis protein
MRQSRVLVVEDDGVIRNLLVEYLTEHGELDVDSARDGIDALHHLATARYDVVVLDVLMPHMSGIDVLDSLEVLSRDSGRTGMADPPAVIVITSQPAEFLGDTAIRRRCPQVVRAVLRKPFDIHTLAEKVERLCSH